MVTVLDIGLLNYFQIIFPFLLIYALTAGILMWTKLLGENKLIHNMIAIVLAFFFVLSEGLVQVVNMMVPWMTIILILLMFLLMAYKFLGAKDSDIAHVLTKDKRVITWILIIFLVIVIGSLSKVYFSEKAPVKEGELVLEEEDIVKTRVAPFWTTIFHPLVLGTIIILLIAVFAIAMLSG